MWRAATSTAAGDAPPNHSGGVGFCTDGSASLPPRTVTKSPSTSTTSPATAARHAGIHSSV